MSDVVIKRLPRTIKEKKFVKEYIKTGNATEAASKVYDVSSRDVARNIGSQNVAKLSIVGVMEKHGLTDDKLIDTLEEGLNADKEAKIGTIEDYPTRHRYLETALKLKGYDAGNNINVNIQNNVISIPTKRNLDTPPKTD
jgi:phage terminase small subunit